MQAQYNKLSLLFLVAVMALVQITAIAPEVITEQFDIKTAQAETECPPPQTSSHMIIRGDDAGGKILGEYHTGDPNPNLMTETLEVDSGTVLYVQAWTEGVELTNRTQGSTQNSSLPVTMISPNTNYYPSGYSFIKQQQVTFVTDPLSSGGSIRVAGTNSCIGDDPVLGESSLLVFISVNAAPDVNLVCDTQYREVTRGDTANFALSAQLINGYANQLAVTMSSSPAGPAMNPTPIYLNTGNGYANTAAVTTGLATPEGLYDLTFSATDGSVTRQCTTTLQVRNTDGTVDLLFNGSDGPTSPTPANGSTGTLTWSSLGDVASCTASMTQGSVPAWSGSRAASGTEVVTGLLPNTDYTFRLSCVTSFTDPVPVDEVVVNVGPANPTADLLCQGPDDKSPQDGPCVIAWDGSAVLSWSSTYTNSCTLTPGSWGTATSGSGSTPNLTADETYTLSCTGPGGSVQDSVTIDVQANPDYSFGISPTTDTVPQGDSVFTSLLVNDAVQGFNSPVTLSVQSISPAGSLTSGDISFDINNQTPNFAAWAQVDTGNAVQTTYTIVFRSDDGAGGPEVKDRTYLLTVGAPSVLNPPDSVAVSDAVCGELNVTWTPPVGGSGTVTAYKVYRKVFGTAGDGTLIYTTPDASTLSYQDNAVPDGQLYTYGVSAMYGGAESAIEWAVDGKSVKPCVASLAGSYKKIVSAGSAIPSMAGNWCTGAASAYSLPSGQVFQSGDTVYFEICVSTENSNVTQSDVTVTEALAEVKYLENIQYISSGSNCVTSGSGSGPFGLGKMDPNEVCGILLKATISDPGGSTGVLRHFVNSADITSDLAATSVSVTEPFVVGSGEPTRTETPR